MIFAPIFVHMHVEWDDGMHGMNSQCGSVRPRFRSGPAIVTLGTFLKFSGSHNAGKLEITKIKKQR